MNVSGILVSLGLTPFSWGLDQRVLAAALPSSAQFIDQKSFNVLANPPPASDSNGTSVCHVSSLHHLAPV